MNTDSCEFCNPDSLKWRTINTSVTFLSFVSNPCFREGHCLVIPRRHIQSPSELTKEEGAEIMGELGRLGKHLDKGYGTGIIQKYMPLQAENGVKMNHLHFHVFPRLEHEKYLFPVPEPNKFEGFYKPTNEAIKKLVIELAP